MDTLENQMGNHTLDRAVFRGNQLHILRTDNSVNRLIGTEARIHAGKFCPQNLHQLILHHNGVKNIAVPDEVRNKSVFRLIVDVLGRTDLLV